MIYLPLTNLNRCKAQIRIYSGIVMVLGGSHGISYAH